MEHVKASVELKRKFRKAKTVKGNEKLTLKKFVKKLADGGDPVASSWFAHKSARFNDEAKQARIKSKGARIALEKAATKAAKRKKAQGKGAKTSTADAKPAV